MSAYVSVLDNQDRPLKQFTGDRQAILELIKNPPREATYGMIQYRRGERIHVFSFQLNTPKGLATIYNVFWMNSVQYMDPTHGGRLDSVAHRFGSIPELMDLIYRFFPELDISKEKGTDIKPFPKVKERDTRKAGRRRKTSRRKTRRCRSK